MKIPHILYDPKRGVSQYVEFKPIRIYVGDPKDGLKVLRDKSRDELFDWCKNNCRGRFWIGMGFGQFEMEEDAVLFSLTWKSNG